MYIFRICETLLHNYIDLAIPSCHLHVEVSIHNKGATPQLWFCECQCGYFLLNRFYTPCAAIIPINKPVKIGVEQMSFVLEATTCIAGCVKKGYGWEDEAQMRR